MGPYIFSLKFIMKCLVLLGLTIIFFLSGFSQTTGVVSKDAFTNLKSKNEHYDAQLSISELNGRPFKNIYADVEGSPFLIENWQQVTIILSHGKKFDRIKGRLDIFNQEAHVMTTEGVEFVIASGIAEMQFVDSASGKKEIFKPGFSTGEEPPANFFYQVLSEGAIQLLKLSRKVISINRNELSGEVVKRFDAHEEYYILTQNKLSTLKRNKEFLLNLFSAKKEAVEKYVKDQRIKLKSYQDLTKLFNYYNSLYQ